MTKEEKLILKQSSVLLMEDSEDLRNKFVRLLSLFVGEVYEASNGLEGIEVFKKHSPSIIITDIETPEMNGLDFIKIIRIENKKIPIIITSAYSHKEYLLEAIKMSLVEYLIKPIELDDLTKALASAAKTISEYTLSERIIIDKFEYCPKNKELLVNGKTIRLSKTEGALLDLLILNRGSLVDKNLIEDTIYPNKYMSDTAIKNVVFKLRKKIGTDIIKTIDKLGYKIEK